MALICFSLLPVAITSASAITLISEISITLMSSFHKNGNNSKLNSTNARFSELKTNKAKNMKKKFKDFDVGDLKTLNICKFKNNLEKRNNNSKKSKETSYEQEDSFGINNQKQNQNNELNNNNITKSVLNGNNTKNEEDKINNDSNSGNIKDNNEEKHNISISKEKIKTED